MGQRHQTYIRILNPNKILSKTIVTAEMRKAFGNEKFTILPFHNQWLYGRTALLHCHNILKHSSQFDIKAKTDKDSYDGYNSPFCWNGIENKFSDPQKWISIIEFIMNYMPENNNYVHAGLLDSWFLGFEFSNFRDDFTVGDNNDGITIVDVINNKYCFMNINGNDDTKKYYDVETLPNMTPVSAYDYVKAYYGETAKTVNPYRVGDKTHAITAKENKKHNKEIVKLFDKFELLTIEEIKDMFPQVAYPEYSKQ